MIKILPYQSGGYGEYSLVQLQLSEYCSVVITIDCEGFIHDLVVE